MRDHLSLRHALGSFSSSSPSLDYLEQTVWTPLSSSTVPSFFWFSLSQAESAAPLSPPVSHLFSLSVSLLLRMSSEAQLHKERLQALAEKRKRQTEIEGKRSQLDEFVMQLQHLKSKATRERWLLQGSGSGGDEEEERRRQLEQDEEKGKKLEDMIHRLESEIGALESEESQISAKEQILRERLRETERSIEDLQKSLQSQDEDAAGCVSSQPPPTGLPLDHQAQTPRPNPGEHNAPRLPAMFAMEINVQQDRRTGEQRVLSANRVSPSEAAARGVKVFDDGRKVVYEVTSSGGVATTENGWSSAQVDQLIQRAAHPVGPLDGTSRGTVTVTPGAVAPDNDLSPPSTAPPPLPLGLPATQTLQRECRLGMEPPPAVTTQPQPQGQISSAPEASKEHPVTMVFLGYQDVEDQNESRHLLGFDGAVKAEVVLIDEDDEKSLREKTVTDLSLMDGTAADLVGGLRLTPLSDAGTELSSDGRDPDFASSPQQAPPPLTPGHGKTTENGYEAGHPIRHPQTAMKAYRAEDDPDQRRERSLKSVSFRDSVSVITDQHVAMEIESQHGRPSSPSRSPHNGVGMRLEGQDPEVVQEICYLDQVLRDASDTPTNGSSSPQENRTITVDGSASSVHVSASSRVNHEVTVERLGQTTFVDPFVKAAPGANGHAEGEESVGRRFELRAYQEEVRPAKLFTPGEEEREREMRVRRTRPSEEVEELEKERQELIKGQAVKMNPGIAQRWWNPPQEAPLEEQLDPEQLESHRKYQERKQRQSQGPAYTQISGHPCMVSFDPESIRKEDIVEEQIDFMSARKQFLQGGGARRDVAPQIYSAKPFARVVAAGNQPFDNPAESGEGHLTWSDEGIGGEFTCARAVMTILKDEEEERSAKLNSSSSSSYPPEEFDSGLDELSVRSQDTTLDNVSDSGASLPPTPLPLTPVSPPTPQPSCPGAGPTEEELEFHAGVLVHHAIQHALASQNGDRWETPDTSTQASFPSPQPSLSPPSQLRSPAPGPEPGHALPFPQSTRQGEDLYVNPDRSSSSSSLSSSMSLSQQQSSSPPKQLASPPQAQPAPQHYTPSPPVPQPISPPRDGGPRIRVQSSYARALAAAPAPAPAPTPVPVPRPAAVFRPPSPPSPERPEFSYFSKYSEAAELRSTAAVNRGPESEQSSGPFRLRSRKQQTLSMIEEEIRAAQQREEELKKERLTLPVPRHGNSSARGNSHAHGNRGPRTTISPGDKMKSNSLPTRLTLTSRTAPGKIEKVRPVPPISPSPSEGALSDASSEDSGGKPKNYMQTLMEDYESHKVKRRDKLEDNSVLEATRVTRRKSNMALKWEAGIYANEDGLENEEEGEEEEEEEEE